MRLLKYVALLWIVLMPAAYSPAQVSIGIGIGTSGYPPPVYEYRPPACAYGYYGYAPYPCAPYGYYGPSYFDRGVFIGAGPWLHGGYGYAPRYYRGGYAYGREGYGRGGYDDDRGEGYRGRGYGYGRGEGYRGQGREDGDGERGGHGRGGGGKHGGERD